MLKKVMLVFAILGLLVATPLAEAAKDGPRNIILFGWDGAQRNHVNECLSRNELPILKKLSKEGAYVEIDIEGVTDTKAGWSQILTGYYPKVTGVYSNRQYQPIPKGLSIGERLEKHFGPDNIVTLAVIGKKGHVDAEPPKKIKVKEPAEQPKAKKQRARKKKAAEAKAAKQKAAKKKAAKANTAKPTPKKKQPVGKIIEENGVKYRLVPGKPHYNMSINTDLFENGLTLDKKVGTRAIELIEKHKDKPFFFFVHFAEVDQKGHKHGENSKEYNDALISNDTWTGKIMDKIKELGLADKTQYYITADHGFNEDGTGHSFAPYVFLATNNKKVNRNGRRQDVAPTILEDFGFNLSKVKPPLNGISLTKPDKRPPAKIGPAKKAAKAPRKQKTIQNRAARKKNRQKSQP